MRKLLIFTGIAMLVMAMISACGTMGDEEQPKSVEQEAENIEDVLAIIADSEANQWETTHDTMPDGHCTRMKSRRFSLPFPRLFNESNYIHYASAERLGISPIVNDSAAWNLKRPIVKVHSCREFYVSELTHSLPFLVPEALDLLTEIGRRFNDSLKQRGGGDYRLKVTSLLRTPTTVKRLRRVNRCATDSSAHQFGTTFDISYTRFVCDKFTVNRTQEDMKNLLAEILLDLRDANRCHVKFERFSGCFHVTTRPKR
jgi:hypothetical protein